MKPKITGSMNLGELVSHYPEAAYVLFAQGVQCMGCGMAVHETIEQGLAAHGYNDADIGTIVDEMNKAVKAAEKFKRDAGIIGKAPKIVPIMPEHLKTPTRFLQEQKGAQSASSQGSKSDAFSGGKSTSPEANRAERAKAQKALKPAPAKKEKAGKARKN